MKLENISQTFIIAKNDFPPPPEYQNYFTLK